MGEVYSHLSEEERQVIQIEIGNGTSIRRIGLMLGRNASTVSGEAKRNTWFPSDENESCRPCRPKRLKTGPWTGGYCIAGPARRRADPQARQTAQAPPPVMRTPVGAGGRMAGSRLVAATHQQQAARSVPRRPRHARAPGDRPPLGLRRPSSP